MEPQRAYDSMNEYIVVYEGKVIETFRAANWDEAMEHNWDRRGTLYLRCGGQDG